MRTLRNVSKDVSYKVFINCLQSDGPVLAT